MLFSFLFHFILCIYFLCVFQNVSESSSDTKDKPCLIYYMNDKPGPEVIKLFSCSTQLSMKF